MTGTRSALGMTALATILLACGCRHPAPEPSEPSTLASAPADAHPDVTIRLGSWNIKKLGHGSSKDYELVAKVIEDHFDILAIVEVMQKGGEHPGYDDLMDALGEEWDGYVTDSPRPNTSAGHAEYYAVLWRDDIAQPCDGWDGMRYHEDGDGSDGGDEEGAPPDLFDREPAFICLETGLDDGEVGFDFILAAYHARWAEGDTDEIAGEVRHLDDVFQAMGGVWEGEEDLIVVGDFNLKPGDLAAAASATDRTDGAGSTLNSSGDITANLYDHVLVWDVDATDEMIGNAVVLDVRDVASSPEAFFQSVSDHLPIMVEVNVTGPDDDHPEGVEGGGIE